MEIPLLEPQQFWLGTGRTGQTVSFWIDTTSVHLSISGWRIKTVPSRLSTVGLARLRNSGARPAGPPPAGRRTLVEEHLWRRTQAKHHGWYPQNCDTPNDPDLSPQQPLQPRDIAQLYRALRKGREDSKDEPGAADFYYGEMEMRRHDKTAPWAERLVLRLYWLFSGYALRATRAFVALALIVAVFAVLFYINGFQDPEQPFPQRLQTTTTSTQPPTTATAQPPTPAKAGPSPPRADASMIRKVRDGLLRLDNWTFSAGTATAIIGGPEALLTSKGQAYRVVLRVLGPLLLGLGILSLRGRIKR
jgi:hypothetical protein